MQTERSSIHSLDYRQKPKCHAHRLTIEGYTVAKIDGEIPSSLHVYECAARKTFDPIQQCFWLDDVFSICFCFSNAKYAVCFERTTTTTKKKKHASCKIKENKLTIQSIEGKNGFCRQTWIESTEEGTHRGKKRGDSKKKKATRQKQIVRVWVRSIEKYWRKFLSKNVKWREPKRGPGKKLTQLNPATRNVTMTSKNISFGSAKN